jgi:hypothetical protein
VAECHQSGGFHHQERSFAQTRNQSQRSIEQIQGAQNIGHKQIGRGKSFNRQPFHRQYTNAQHSGFQHLGIVSALADCHHAFRAQLPNKGRFLPGFITLPDAYGL